MFQKETIFQEAVLSFFSHACWSVSSKRNGFRIRSTSVNVLLQCIVYNCALTVLHTVELKLEHIVKLRYLQKICNTQMAERSKRQSMKSTQRRDGKCGGGKPLEGIPFMLKWSQLTAVSFKPVQIKSCKTPNPDHCPSTRYKFSNFYLGGRADVLLDPTVKNKQTRYKIVSMMSKQIKCPYKNTSIPKKTSDIRNS